MKAKIYLNLLLAIAISVTTLYSCKSSFPTAGTPVECNGELLNPILNPTKKAEFIGGEQAIYQFLRANINLPQDIDKEEITGKIRVAFIVTKKGEICDVRITSKPKEHLDVEVVRVMEIMPKWSPGINEGEIVDSYYLMDIKF